MTLAWPDAAGKQRLFGPMEVSPEFHAQASRSTDRTARIRCLDDQPAARPLILAEAARIERQEAVGLYGGLGLLAVGLAMAPVLWRRLRSAAA